jgi:hypothetical protein
MRLFASILEEVTKRKFMVIAYIEVPVDYWTCSHNVVYSYK